MHEDYLRSMLFGLQDGIVSTTGVVAGISAGVEDRSIIILASLVAVAVEASSMGAGQYSSEKAVHQMEAKKASQGKSYAKHTDSVMFGALIMFFAYFAAGAIPIVPMLLTQIPLDLARIISIGSAFIALFLIGFIKGKIVEEAALRSAVEMLFIGGMATIVGLLVGITLKI